MIKGAVLLVVVCGLGADDGAPAAVSAAAGSAVVSVRGVRIVGSVTPGLLRFGGASVTATLTLTTGARSRTAAIGVEPSLWSEARVGGSPLRITHQVITGTGHQTGGYAAGGGITLPGASSCIRGAPSYDGGGIDLFLPARSTTTVSWQTSFAAPPWPSQNIGLGWVVGVPASARASGLIAQRQVGPLALQRVGATGVHLRLHARRGTQPPARPDGYPRVRIGGAVQIIGTTLPAVGGARVQVAEISTISHHRRAIATVTTHSNGRFATTWRPRRPGNFTITSAIDHPPDGLLPDRSCDLALTAISAPPSAHSNPPQEGR